MTTLESLKAKIKKLKAQADSLAAKKSSAVIEKIRELMGGFKSEAQQRV
ncbi:hypothetical protein [Paraburkholderia sp. 40]